MGYLFIPLLVALSSAALADPLDDIPVCPRVQQASYSAPVSLFLDSADNQVLPGTSFRLRTHSIDRSEAKLDSQVFGGSPYGQTVGGEPYPWRALVHNMEVVDANGVVVGYADFNDIPGGVKLRAIEVREDLQDQGITTKILEAVGAALPTGHVLTFYSANIATNEILDRYCDEIEASYGYQKFRLRHGPVAAQGYLSVELTNRIKVRKDGERGPLWANVLKKAGFSAIRVDVDAIGVSRNFSFVVSRE